MKRLIVFLLLFAAIKVAGQTTGYLRFDTVRIYRQGGTAELVLMNKTKDTIGLLTNVGNGLTRFVRSRKLNDSTFTIGLDTISLSGGTAATVDLDSLRNATQLRIVNGLDTTIFESATTSLAGAFPATDKVKVNRWEPYLNFTDLRANTNIDTSVIYTDKNQNWFRYDPTDAVTADDSSSTIVVGSARLKRVFNGIYRPEDFGAKGDGTTNDWWAWQKMMNYMSTTGGTIWCDPRASYKIDTTMTISLTLDPYKPIIIQGNGCKMSGKDIFRKRPVDQTAALNNVDSRVDIYNIIFTDLSSVTSTCIEIGATQYSTVQGCEFFGFDSTLVFRFGLHSTAKDNKYTNCINGSMFLNGDWTGANTANAQSNKSSSIHERFFGHANSVKGFTFIGASGCVIENWTIEGAGADYGIYFDYGGGTNVPDFTVRTGHQEAASGRATIYARVVGDIYIDNVYPQFADTLINIDRAGGNPTVHVSRIHNVAISKFVVNSTQAAWRFDNMTFSFVWSSPFVVSGSYVLPTSVLHTHGNNTVRSPGLTLVSDGNMSIQASSVNVQGTLRPSVDATYTWGLTNNRPNMIYTRALRLLNGQNLSWSDAADATDVSLSRPVAGSLKLTGTGVFGLAGGTTAQRPTGAAGYLRFNSDSTGNTAELYNTSASIYETIASRNWTRLNFATFSQIAAQIHDSLGTSTTVVREPVVVIDGGTDPDTITIAGLNGFGSAGQLIRVNSGATGLEYFTSSAVSSPYIYQFVSTQQITVTNTVTATTIYGTGTGSASVDGTANVTTGTKITLRGSGEIDTDASAAGDITFSFVTNNNTLSIPVTGLANALADASYDYEYTIIPLGTGATQDAIYYFNIHIDNNGTPLILKGTGRVTGAFTTTGTWATDVTVEWSAADTDNTVVANFNTVEIFKK